MNIIIVLLIIIFITIIGFSLISFFNLLSGFCLLSKIAYSFGLGITLTSFQLYVFSRLSIPWTKPDLIIPWLIIIILTLIKNMRNLSMKIPEIPKFKKIDWILTLLIIFCISYAVFEALIRPPVAWDSWAAWLFQSKVFFLSGKIDPGILRHFNLYYPLLNYLSNTFFFIVMGKVDDTAILLVSSAFYFFLTILFFDFIKQRYGFRRGLLFTFLFVSTQNLIRHGGRMESGLADLPLGFFSFCSVALLFEYIKSSSRKTLAVLSIFLCSAALVKSEGLALSIWIGMFAILHIYKNKLYGHLTFLLLWMVPVIDWEIYKRISGINNYFLSHSLIFSLSKAKSAFTGTFKELINIKSWNVLWITYFYTLLLKPFKNKELFILNFVIISQLILYVLTYIFTQGNSPDSSIERLLIHLAPIVMLEIVIFASFIEYKDVVKSISFENSEVVKFINDFISRIDGN